MGSGGLYGVGGGEEGGNKVGRDTMIGDAFISGWDRFGVDGRAGYKCGSGRRACVIVGGEEVVGEILSA